jgi:XTP/dITP diphosphohydrolase
MIPTRLVLATSNAGKVRELAEMMVEWGPVEVVSLADFPDLACPEESADSYAGNALLKATAIADATRLPALADDSGIEVDALGGAPGLHSARYAETAAARIEKLLAALAAVPDGARRARFRGAVALAWPDGRTEVGEGEVAGTIVHTPRGDGGFGYDPVFAPDELAGRTFGEATAEEKRVLGHRGRAMRALAARMRRTTLRPPGGPC